MILVDWQIRNACKNGLIDPFDEELLNPSSIDVRIGISAMVDTKHGFTDYPNFKYHTKNDPYYILPNDCILVGTLERINLPIFYAAELKLKSSRAREGLNHALAGWIDNGYRGIITLELKNNSIMRSVPIYPGLRIGQLIIMNTTTPETPYNGKYQDASSVLPSSCGDLGASTVYTEDIMGM
jgi:dCTP deaminase